MQGISQLALVKDSIRCMELQYKEAFGTAKHMETLHTLIQLEMFGIQNISTELDMVKGHLSGQTELPST